MNKKLAIFATIAIALAGGIYFMTANKTSADSEVVSSEALPIHLQDRVLGEAAAPVTIIEYANYTCTHCGDFHRTVFDKLKTEYIDTGKIKFIHREVVTDGPGLLATSLARCLPENQYFGMASVLYNNQQEWAYDQTTLDGVKDALRKYANLAGLAPDALNKCFDDQAKQEEILNHFRGLAEADKIKGTPSLYVNGAYVDNWAWDQLKPVIDAALK